MDPFEWSVSVEDTGTSYLGRLYLAGEEDGDAREMTSLNAGTHDFTEAMRLIALDFSAYAAAYEIVERRTIKENA
jgi:hypothetical protein